MGIPNINNFLSNLNSLGGAAKSERFTTTIFPPNMSLLYALGAYPLTMLCESSEMPGRHFDTINYRTYGPNKRMVNNSQYQDQSLSFICTNSFIERRFFDTWMNQIQPTSNWNLKYKSQYSASILITQFGLTGNIPIYAIMLRNAFPISVNPQSLHWSDNSIHRLTVNFAYDYWTSADSMIADAVGGTFDKLVDAVGDIGSKFTSTAVASEAPFTGEVQSIVERQDLPVLTGATPTVTGYNLMTPPMPVNVPIGPVEVAQGPLSSTNR